MANSAATVLEAPVLEEPEYAMDWNTFYNQFGQEKYGKDNWVNMDPDHWFTKLGNFFSGDRNQARNYYEKYLNDVNLRNEYKATQSARAWDEYMANTAYSRAFADLERAGVNPYLLLNSGSTPGTSVGSSTKASYQTSRSSIKDAEGSGKARDLALTIFAIAKIIALLG